MHPMHAIPIVPQALGAVPIWHCPAEQQPLHEVPSHTQRSLAQ
jgi:hypothetical protein